MVSELAHTPRGLWWIMTVSGSDYFLDFGQRVVVRTYDADTNGEGMLRQDGHPIGLIRLLHCVIGDRMILLVNLNLGGGVFTTRVSTAVLRIEQLRTFPPLETGTDSL